MIIKKVNVIAFGGLKNKIVEFNNGVNIIYGENESGKSTIENFIKIWLYGFSSSRTKDLRANERVRFAPIDGESMRGELYLEHNGKDYIISRTFGKTKKQDTSVVLDGLTGEAIDYIPFDEPGKYFLSINRSTFCKTLFIGQLDMEVKKDKEEEILDKISNMLGAGEGDVTIDKALLKLENYRKSLKTSRKNGRIDSLNNRYSELIEERYEGYTLSEQNIENEERLLNLKDNKKSLKSELENLEIYKKYLKKIKLQKQYEEISEYLSKSEELKSKDKAIREALTYNEEVVTNEFINQVKEELSMYLSLQDLKNEDLVKLEEKIEKLNILKEPISKLGYINDLDSDISQELLKLKIEQSNLLEKVELNNKIEAEIKDLNQTKAQRKNSMGKAINIESIRDEVHHSLQKYEDSLKELKYMLDMEKGSVNTLFIKGMLVVFSIIIAILAIATSNTFIKVALIIIAIVSIILFLFLDKIKGINKNSRVTLLKKEILKLERALEQYSKSVNVNDFGQLLKALRVYDEYTSLEENINIKLKEKESQRELLALEKAIEKYNNNDKQIEKYKKLLGVETLEEVIKAINEYENNKRSCSSIEIDIENSNENIKRIEEQLEIRENKIRENIKALGLENIDLYELSEKLKELKRKINERIEIINNLQAIEETYSVLSKGKNIEAIKEELKDIVKIGVRYSYKSEEEIDEATKEKSNKLIVVEKEIKDVENEISNRFKGKRRLPDIEEEIEEVEVNILEEENNLKATDFAVEILKESYEEIRRDFGPILNTKVINKFEEFTEGKYKEVKVSDKYEMKIKNNNQILSAEMLSNGAKDQLFLALRLAFVEMIFKSKDLTLYLDDAFVQYDDIRLEKAIEYLYEENFKQIMIFTCQNREKNVLDKLKLEYFYKNI